MRIRLVIGLLLFTLAACEAPTAPSDDTVETLSGTVQPGEIDVKRFFVMKEGVLEVTLQALTPGGVSVVGIGYGNLYLTGKDCNFLGSTRVTAANVGKSVMWNFAPGVVAKIGEGPHCIAVFDPAFHDATIARLGVAQSYTLQVIHS